MSNEVKRYDPINGDGTCGMCIEDADYGAYVEYADYAALEAELAKLRAGQESLLLNLAEQKRQAVEYREMWAKAVASSPQPSAVPEVTKELAALAWHRAYAEGDDSGVDMSLRVARHVAALLATPPATVQGDEVRPLYTCIGKGGEYRYLGTAIGAGDSRGELAEVYQDRTGQLFHRTPEDFMERMEPIAAARKGEV